MGTIDSACRALISQKDVFCDVFRLLLHGQDIKIHDVKPVVPDVWLTDIRHNQTSSKHRKPQKYNKVKKALQLLEFRRDVLKNCVCAKGDKLNYIMLGVENQAYCDALMPARVMIYDALTLHMQMETLKSKHTANCHKTSDAFLSGVPENTKLKGVLTVVCYFGTKPWKGPKSLHEILDIPSPELKKLVPDYPIYVIDPHSLTDDSLGLLNTSLREVFTCIKWANSRTELEKAITSNPRFCHVSTEAAHVIQACTNLNIIQDPQQKEINMCQAVEEWKKELLDIGYANGEKDGYANGKKDGYANGEKDGIERVAKNMILTNCFAHEHIAELTGLSMDKVQKLAMGIKDNSV